MEKMTSFNFDKTKYKFKCNCGKEHTVDVPQKECKSIGVCHCGEGFDLSVKKSNLGYDIIVTPIDKEVLNSIIKQEQDIEIFDL